MKETTNLKLKLPEPTDFYNVQDMNDNTNAIDAAFAELQNGQDGVSEAVKNISEEVGKKAESDHTHNIEDIENFPESMPANGGNAATVGGHTVDADVPVDAKFTDTIYSSGAGISISGTTINNSGVRSVSSGSSNGTIAVNTNGTTANVAVKGLASAAYQAVQTTASTVGLHRISSGSDEATTANCPAGCWRGQYE